MVLRAHMLPQAARPPARVGAVRALVVPALLVHQAHMLLQAARKSERSGAADARVRPGVRRGALLLALLVLSRHRSQRSRAKSLRSVEECLLGGGGMLEEAFYYAINHRRAQNMRSEHAVLAQRTTQRQVWRQALARRRVRAQTERAHAGPPSQP